MNARNVSLISVHNPRKFYPRVDDKLQTKLLAEKARFAVPELYGVIRSQGEVSGLQERLSGYSGFVIKPTHGSAGQGVLVISDRKGDEFLKPSGEVVGAEVRRRLVLAAVVCADGPLRVAAGPAELWSGYLAALEADPLPVKMATAACVIGAGDATAQLIENERKKLPILNFSKNGTGP